MPAIRDCSRWRWRRTPTPKFFNGQGIELGLLRRGIELEAAASATTMALPSGALAQILFWSDDYEAARPAYEQIVQSARERGELYETGALLFESGDPRVVCR